MRAEQLAAALETLADPAVRESMAVHAQRLAAREHDLDARC